MENKVSSTINIKQIHVYHPKESKSINHQIIISLESISKTMSRMLDPPPSSKLLLHELVQWIPLLGTMKFVHACWKSKKIKKISWKQWKCIPEGKWQQKVIEIWILCLDIWGWNLKIENYSSEKYFEDLNQN